MNIHKYQVKKIGKFEELWAYSKYTEWCLIFTEIAYEFYTDEGRNSLYVLIRDDMELLTKKKEADYPCDEYGLSLLAVIGGPDGKLISVTSRWNSLEEDDHLINEQQLKELLGDKFSELFLI